MSTGIHRKIAKTQTFKFRDIFIDSSELKKLIKARMKELNVSTKQVAEANNVYEYTFNKYLMEDKSLSTKNLRQEHLLNIAESLGIKIRVQLIPSKLEDIDRSFFEKK